MLMQCAVGDGIRGGGRREERIGEERGGYNKRFFRDVFPVL